MPQTAAREFQVKMNTAVRAALTNMVAICETLINPDGYPKSIDTLAGATAADKIPDGQIELITGLRDQMKAILDNDSKFKTAPAEGAAFGGSRRRFRKRALIRGSYRKRRYSRG